MLCCDSACTACAIIRIWLPQSEWDHSALVIDGRLRIRSLLDFMLNLDGPLSVVVDTDPFWYNRMLLELDVEANDELEGIRYSAQHVGIAGAY